MKTRNLQAWLVLVEHLFQMQHFVVPYSVMETFLTTRPRNTLSSLFIKITSIVSLPSTLVVQTHLQLRKVAKVLPVLLCGNIEYVHINT